MPSSGWSQWSHSQSTSRETPVQPSVYDLQAVDVAQVGGVEHLAVDVELQLVGRAVADPHRPRAAPALEVVEAFLGQVGASVDPVHDLRQFALA